GLPAVLLPTWHLLPVLLAARHLLPVVLPTWHLLPGRHLLSMLLWITLLITGALLPLRLLGTHPAFADVRQDRGEHRSPDQQIGQGVLETGGAHRENRAEDDQDTPCAGPSVEQDRSDHRKDAACRGKPGEPN